MDMRQLVTFRTVAQTLSFTRTAATLNYVQSTVTAQIQALENELGVQLFDRLGKRVVLTTAGHRLLEYAEKILTLADEAKNAVASQEEPAGLLTISTPESFCIYRLPAILLHFRARYPKVQVLFRPFTCAEIRRCVADGTIDVAFVLDKPVHSTELAVEALIAEPIAIVALPDHPLSTFSSVDAIDIIGETVVLTELGCTYRTLFEQALIHAGVRPDTMLEFSNVEAIKQCVMAGMGLGVLPEFVVKTELEQGRLTALPWTESDLTVLTQMVWHKDKWLSPALSAFLQVAREVLYTPTLEQPIPSEMVT